VSDNFIILIPRDPRLIPTPTRRESALASLAQIVPEADEIELVVEEGVAFFDCGGNFERAACPQCGAELTEWWSDHMGEDYGEGGFRLAVYATPCCAHACSLNDLVYEWPQGFARFAVSIRNAGFGELGQEHVRELAETLGTSLRLIYKHL